MKRIIKMKTVCHGLHNDQEFQGCNVSFTEFDECVTGIGNTAYAAKEDALEQIAYMGYDVDDFLNTEDNSFKHCDDEDNLHMYVSLLFKTEEII